MNTQDIINKIAKLKDAIEGETDPDIKARYQKKLKELQGDLGEVKQEIKEEKKEPQKDKRQLIDTYPSLINHFHIL
jgi:hypothetical protein